MAGIRSYAPPGIGHATFVNLANPAAGANFTWTVPTGAGAPGPDLIILIESIRFQYACVAAGPAITVTYSESGGALLSQAVTAVATTAFATTTYAGAPGVTNHSIGLNQVFNLPLVFLETGDVVASAVVAIGPADQITNCRIRFRQWFAL